MENRIAKPEAARESEADRRRRHAYKNGLYSFMYGGWGSAFDQAAVSVFPGSVPNPRGAPRPANPDGSINPDLYIPPANS